MNQVSKPMQIVFAGVLLFALVWFFALRPKEVVIEPIAATPAPATTPRADAGGDKAASALGKTVESAKDAGAAADAAVKGREQQTGEESDTSAAATPPATASNSSTPTASARGTGAAVVNANANAAAKPAAKKSTSSPAQDRADSAIRAIKRDLAARRAVVVLVYSTTGKEDNVLYTRVKKEIDRRGGRVRTYFIKVGDVGRYDGLLSGLALSQTPSTVVIAPDNTAKVLGGLTSTERIDRLTSSALQIKPVATP